MPRRERSPTGSGFKKVLALGVGGLVLFMIYANRLASEILFQPESASYEPSDLEENFLRIPAEDGVELAAFWAKHASPDAWTAFVLYGNSDDIGRVLPLLGSYRLQGYNVICFDYRGYGQTAGKPQEYQIYADAETVYDYLIQELGVSEDKILLHGKSMGGGVATELAMRKSPAGLILQSTYRSLYKNMFSFHWFPGDAFDTESKIGEVECPILFIHGIDDEVVEISQSRELMETAGGAKNRHYWVEGAGHSDVEIVAGLNYWIAIREFVKTL